MQNNNKDINNEEIDIAKLSGLFTVDEFGDIIFGKDHYEQNNNKKDN